MTDYRCYCLSRDGHIQKASVITSDDDESARRRAAVILEACHHDTIEIWQGARRVGQVSIGARPAGRRGEARATPCHGCAP